MKKINLCTIAFVLIGIAAFSQNCLPVKQGQKYTLSSTSYDTPVAQDINKWTKTKPNKREQIIAEHNENVVSGKMKPKYTFEMTYDVSEVNKLDGKDHALMTTTINNVKYESHITCDNDNIYMARHYGFQEAKDPQGNKTGYSMLGVAKFPKTLNIGDAVEPYIDYVWTYPKSQVYQHNVVIASGQSSAGHGLTKSWIQYVPVDVQETKSNFTRQIHNMNSEITEIVDFKLGKDTYSAYVIESEVWTKTETDYSYKSDDSRIDIDKMNEKVSAYWQEKIERKMERKKLSNDMGFIVSYKTEWYVPELGIVNLIVKSQGFITNETKLTQIK